MSNDKVMTTLTEDLWSLINKMRGHINTSKYKQFFFTFFIYKYISDYWKEFTTEKNSNLAEQNDALIDIIDNPRFIIPENTEFDALKAKRRSPTLGYDINMSLEKIELENKEKLDGVFSYLDFNDSRVLGEGEGKNTLLISLLDYFEKISFEPSAESNDLIADSFEQLYAKFALQEGKGGEAYYTPDGIGELLAKLLQPKNHESIYDPCCGSGSLLIKLKQEVEKPATDCKLYGQEISKDMHAIAKMNMIIHEFDDANICWGDSLNNPQFVSNTYSKELQKFDIVVSNPPFSITNWRKSADVYHQFKWGIPPDNKGDFAFIQHMLASTAETIGRMGVIVSLGVLFRGGPELTIRQKILEDNLLDAVIGLPGNLLSYTGIPVAILLFSKSRLNNSDILFIDATREFKPDKRRNVLTPEGIENIVSAYKEFKLNPSHNSPALKEGFSYICSIKELAANDYNLNISRYIHYKEEEEKVDIRVLRSEVERLDVELNNIRNEIKKNLSELGL